MTKILITNAYSWYNKGDAGIVMGMIKTFDEIFDDPEYTIYSFTPEVDSKRYPVEATFLNEPLGTSFGPDRTNRYILPFRALKQAVEAKTTWGRTHQLLEMKSADIVVSCGGGFLGGHSIHSLVHVYSLELANLMQKPYVIYAQSINDLKNKWARGPTKHVLRNSKLVLPREVISKRYLESLELGVDIELIPDAAFMLESSCDRNLPNEVDGPLDGDMIVGLTAREWSFPDSDDPETKLQVYIQSMAALVEHFHQNHNADVVFLPQVIYAPHDDDRGISRRILETASIETGAYVLTDDYTPPDLISLTSECDAFIGTRMHSNIFAINAGVPTGAISYQPKTDGIMEMVDLKEYTVDIAEITPSKLIELADSLLENKQDIERTITKRREALREDILQGAKRLKELC